MTFNPDGKTSVIANPDQRKKNAIQIEANVGPLWTGLSNILITTPPVPTPTATPFYVGRYGTVQDSVSWLYPSSKVMVWIGDQTIKSGTMFLTALQVAEIDLSTAPVGILGYSAGNWMKGSLTGALLPSLDWKNGAFVPHTETAEIPVAA